MSERKSTLNLEKPWLSLVVEDDPNAKKTNAEAGSLSLAINEKVPGKHSHLPTVPESASPKEIWQKILNLSFPKEKKAA